MTVLFIVSIGERPRPWQWGARPRLKTQGLAPRGARAGAAAASVGHCLARLLPGRPQACRGPEAVPGLRRGSRGSRSPPASQGPLCPPQPGSSIREAPGWPSVAVPALKGGGRKGGAAGSCLCALAVLLKQAWRPSPTPPGLTAGLAVSSPSGPGCPGAWLAGWPPCALQEALPGGGGGLLCTAGLATRLAPRPGGLPGLWRREASAGGILGDPPASGRGGWGERPGVLRGAVPAEALLGSGLGRGQAPPALLSLPVSVCVPFLWLRLQSGNEGVLCSWWGFARTQARGCHSANGPSKCGFILKQRRSCRATCRVLGWSRWMTGPGGSCLRGFSRAWGPGQGSCPRDSRSPVWTPPPAAHLPHPPEGVLSCTPSVCLHALWVG
ncbi:uncharacterized protein LOC114897742 [Monodon monoceros]|uniref:uncharacterized protein LOC114897742 n=1 Tax=Monodon monoceros TaxID=40151 RepID=UPI0010F9CCAE|nr:uncharacterized protein LOC114897742 [Monodon monoceros]